MGQDIQGVAPVASDGREKNSGNPAKEKSKLTLGYNVLQLGFTPVEFGEVKNDYRLRAYSNIGIENSDLHLRFQGLNERGVGYTFGRNSLRAGPARFPVDIVVASRYFGVDREKAGLLDVGVGVRVDLSKLSLIDYGFADILKQTGIGKSAYSGPEIVTFWGKQIGPVTIESTMAKKSAQPLFIELEVLMKPIESFGNTKIKPFLRSESFDAKGHSFTAGLQLQFPSVP